jgi:hypothetical protein
VSERAVSNPSPIVPVAAPIIRPKTFVRNAVKFAKRNNVFVVINYNVSKVGALLIIEDVALAKIEILVPVVFYAIVNILRKERHVAVIFLSKDELVKSFVKTNNANLPTHIFTDQVESRIVVW